MKHTLMTAGMLLLCAMTADAQTAGRYAGRPLADVLRDLQSRDLKVAFSSELVRPEMHVLSEPKSTTPRKILDEVLAPHGLRAAAGPKGTWLVVQGRKTPATVKAASVSPPSPSPALAAVMVAGQVIAAASNAPVTGAVIDAGGQRTTTDSDGRFAIEAAPGLLRLEVTAKGFINPRVDMTVTPGMSAVEIALEPSPEFREKVTAAVNGARSIVDAINDAVGTKFTGAMLRDIPNQRDLNALLAETPGISMPRPDIGGNTAGTQSGYRAYGLSGQTITTVDGVNITDGSSGVGAYIDYGAIAEAKIAAAGNTAEIPVAGAAVTTVIKSGSNTWHGQFYPDFKSGGSKGYNGSENYEKYRDINAQMDGPFIKDRFWYFTSFRDQYTGFLTGMYDKPAAKGGQAGQPFTTETTDYTIKLNSQLNRTSSLTFMTQWGRKYQPYRFGSGGNAYQYLVESTALQDSWSAIGKVEYSRVLNNRATLDTSINSYGTQFPLNVHTNKTPIIDDVTFARSGGYNTPSFSQDRRWHYNTNLTLFAENHDMKIGYMFQWYPPRFTARGAPGPDGTAGHFFIGTTNGVPTAFWTDNGPVWNQNVLKNHALFFQDKFQVTPKLAFNFGIRFDQFNSSYPEQRFGLNGDQPCVDDRDCDIGPFVVNTVAPANDIVTFNTFAPRVALIYDVFGSSKTALKASWGRFSTNPAASIASLVNPIDLITKKYAWDTAYLTADPAIAATRITPAYVATLRPIFGGAQLTPAAVDPKLKDSYIDEYTFGAEQEITSDLRAHVMFVRKQQRNTFGRYDRLRTLSSYTPVRVLDPGPDGIVKGQRDDDRIITVWETGVPPDMTDYYLTNKPIGDDYQTFELGLTKRMSAHWQLIGAFDWTKRDLSSLFTEDPNLVAWNSTDTQTAGWTLKASGSYLFKWGIMGAVFYNGMKGEPYGRVFTVTPQYMALADPSRTTPLVQGNMTIAVEKPGTYYLPNLHLVSVRAQKEFVIKQTVRLHLMFNVFNFFDVKTVTGVDQTTGRNFNRPTIFTGEGVVRLSARFTF